jgi:GNAT superfamily N-acetyltransferase
MMTRMCRLTWDSSFFGFPVYKRSIESVRDFSGFRQEVLSDKAKDECGVCYLFIPSELYPLLADYLSELGGVSGGSKVFYSLAIDSKNTLSSSNEIKPILCINDTVRRLAVLSGRYSRFAMDPAFSSRCDDMYERWIEKCFQACVCGESVVLGFFEGDCAVGFLSLSFNDETASIDLLAVDEGKQRRGIGRSLVNAAINMSRDKGCGVINVATQGNNWTARRLYESCGFQSVDLQCIWHLRIGAHSLK